MKKSLFLFLLIISTKIIAQSPKIVVNSFVFGGKVLSYNLKIENNGTCEFIILGDSCSTLGKNSTNINSDISSKEKSFKDKESSVFYGFEQGAFKTIFYDQLKRFSKCFTQIDSSKLSDLSIRLFMQINANLLQDDEPITAYVHLKKDTVKSLLLSNSAFYYSGPLSKVLVDSGIDKIQIETSDGTIKNVSLLLKDPQNSFDFLEFKNLVPISISGKFDPDFFSKVKLYCQNCGGIDGLVRVVKLSDVIQMKIIYEIDKDDFSPANTVIELSKTQPIVPLKKEKRSKIFEVSAFSDFVGLNNPNPNGLIQIDAKKRININTNYRNFSRRKNKTLLDSLDYGDVVDIVRINADNFDTNKKLQYYRVIYENVTLKSKKDSLQNKKDTLQGRSDNLEWWRGPSIIKIPTMNFHSKSFVFLNNIEPRFLISKIEDRQVYLTNANINNFGNEADTSNLKQIQFNAINLIKFQLATFGSTINIFQMNLPQEKISLSLDCGLFWMRNKAQITQDKKLDTLNINSVSKLLGASITFRPDSRWGVSMGVDFNHINTWNPEVKSVGNWVSQFKFDGHLKTNDTSKLFFRFRFNQQTNDKTINFSQIQLGYLMEVFKNKNENK